MDDIRYITIPYDKAVKELRSGLVRAVFITKDKRERLIFATRNSQLMAKYGASNIMDYNQSIIEDEMVRMMINVYDVQKEDFRKINLNTLLEFEIFTGKVPPLEENTSAISKTKTQREREDKDTLKKKILEKTEIGANKILDELGLLESASDLEDTTESEKHTVTGGTGDSRNTGDIIFSIEDTNIFIIDDENTPSHQQEGQGLNKELEDELQDDKTKKDKLQVSEKSIEELFGDI